MAQSYNFDGNDKIIQLSTTESFTILDMYSRWKDWVLTDDNAKFLPAFSYVGGESTVGSDTLGITYFMINGWRVRPYNSAQHRLVVEGNIFTPEGSSSFSFPTGSYSVLIEQKVSNLVDVKTVNVSGSNSLSDTRIQEIWQLHGLDIDNPLVVTQISRSFADISQSISTVGSGSIQETVITRL